MYTRSTDYLGNSSRSDFNLFSSCFQAAFLADQGKGQLEEVGNQRSVGRSGKQKPWKPWKFIEIRLIFLESVIFLALCKATVGIWLKTTID